MSDETPRIGAPYLVEGQGSPEVTINTGLFRQDMVIQAAVLDRDLTAPPGSPDEGDCYLVAAPVTGAWASHEGDLASWDGSAWQFVSAWPGFTAYVVDEAVMILRDGGGSWVPLVAAAGVGISDVSGLTAALAAKQDANVNLTAEAGLSGAADKLSYYTGAGAKALTDLTPAARTVLDDATTAAMLTTLGALPLAGGTMTGTITNGQATQCLNFTNVSGTVLFRGVTTFGTGISANRFYQIDASGQPTARYDDNGVVTGLTLQNYGLTGANQGANLFVCQLGTGGAALGDRGEISLMATDTYADGAHATNRFVFRPVSAGVKAARFLIEGNGDLKSSFGIFVDGNGHLRLRSYTVATLPSSGLAAGMTAYCSDLGGGGGDVVCNGTLWKREKEDGVATVSSDAAFTLTPLTSAPTQVHTGTLTADRAITLSTTNAYNGTKFRVTRTGAGAFNLSVGGLKALATNTWADVEYDGSAWKLTAYGAL